MKTKILETLLILMFFGLGTLFGADDSAEICITFDDLPAVPPTEEAAKEITTKLLAILSAETIPAIGFVNENKLERDGKTDAAMVEFLKMWTDAGLELGNHTYSHMDFHRNSLEAFEQDLIRGENTTRELLKEKGKNPHYFRHPYLHTGKDPDTRQKLAGFLKSRGYEVAPVTVDNSDWIFARAYDNALQDADLKQRIANVYVPYMADKIDYYEKQSQMLFGRKIRQILLVHANRLNADHFAELVKMMRAKGYKFISLKEALQDEAYRSTDSYMGPAGISWIHRWAITRGVKTEFFRGEPVTPGFIMKLAGVDEE